MSNIKNQRNDLGENISALDRSKEFSRRDIFRKSGGLAGAAYLSLLTGIAGFSVPGVASANPVHEISKLPGEDPQLDYFADQLGIQRWDMFTLTWENSDDAMWKSGRLLFKKKQNLVYKTMYHTSYYFKFHQTLFPDGLKDLDITTPLYLSKITRENEFIPVYTTGPRDEFRRRLQDNGNWGNIWRIPASWGQEFLNWTTLDTESGQPNFGVVMRQLGNTQTNAARRVFYVYKFEYRRNLGRWERRATLRRIMTLFAGRVNSNWANIAIDDVNEQMRFVLSRGGVRDAINQYIPVLTALYPGQAPIGYFDNAQGLESPAMPGWMEASVQTSLSSMGPAALATYILPSWISGFNWIGIYQGTLRAWQFLHPMFLNRFQSSQAGYYPGGRGFSAAPRMNGAQEGEVNVDESDFTLPSNLWWQAPPQVNTWEPVTQRREFNPFTEGHFYPAAETEENLFGEQMQQDSNGTRPRWHPPGWYHSLEN